MKKLLVVLFFFSIIFSCKEKCPTDSKCLEKPETGATCQAYFESWIYDSDKNECELQGYSGCSAVGFETKEECDKCDCKE